VKIDTLDRTVGNVASAIRKRTVQGVPFRLAHALQQHLLGSLREDEQATVVEAIEEFSC
jgi:hypothetical protein